MSKGLPGDPALEQLATPEEVLSAWKTITVADRKRLAAYAETLARRHQFADAGMTRNDLLQEMNARAFGETRSWQLKQETFMQFMFGILRSIAGDLKRTKAGKVRAASASLDLQESEIVEGENLIDRNDPETILITREEEERAASLVKNLQQEFKDDQDVLLAIEGLLEGLPPREIRALLNMSETEYDAVRHKIGRRVRKMVRPH
jgi:hypothetical protein